MKKPLFPVVLLLTLSFSNAFSQNWAANPAGGANDIAYRTYVDIPTGNVYVAGSTGANSTIYFEKYNSSGARLWSASIGTAGTGAATDIAFRNGYVYVVGYFNGTNIDFDPGTGVATLSSNAGSIDIFMAKFIDNGNSCSFYLANNIGGPEADKAQAIELDASGGLYISGSFQNTVDFDFTGGTANRSGKTGTALVSGFVLKYSQPAENSFVLNWATALTDASDIRGLALDEANAALFICGSYISSGTSDFSPPPHGSSSVTLPSTQSYDGFLAKFGMNNGAGIKAIRFNSTEVEEGTDIDFYNGNIYMTGYVGAAAGMSPPVFFDTGLGAQTSRLTSGSGDFFVASYTANNVTINWLLVSGSSQFDVGWGIAANADGMVMTGSFKSSFTLNSSTYTSNGAEDIMVSNFDISSGNLLGKFTIGGASSDEGMGVALNGAGRVIITGYFRGTVNFQPWSTAINLTSTANDIFTAEYTIAGLLPIQLSNFSAFIADESVNLTWRTNQEQNNIGFNIQRFTNNTWSTIGFVSGAGNSSIPKDYSYTDIPKQSGTILYRLEQIDFDGKTTLSNVVKVDMGPLKFKEEVYPNPSRTQTSVAYTLPEDAQVLLQIFDANGRLIKTVVNEKQKAGYHLPMIYTSGMASGMYYYRLNAGKYKAEGKMVVE